RIMHRATAKLQQLPKTCDGLNALCPLRPIRDDVDLSNAQEVVDALAVLSTRSRDQKDYLETLSTLVEKYEQEQGAFTDDDASVIDVLKFLMEGREMSASDLGRLLGNRELGAAILRGDRQLSKANILKLAEHFA